MGMTEREMRLAATAAARIPRREPEEFNPWSLPLGAFKRGRAIDPATGKRKTTEPRGHAAAPGEGMGVEA